MIESKNILVTGGAGYIGSHTVVELINAGYTPVILDDYRNSDPRIIEGVKKITQKDFVLREVDVCDLSAVELIFQEFVFVGIIHFAAYKAVGESVAEPLKYYRNNILGLLNCLELADRFNVKNFVFSSSCTVYGEPEGEKTVSENSEILKAFSPYGNTKQICEEILTDFIKSGSQMRVLNLRYFNPVGAHSSGLIGELPIGRPNNLFPIVAQFASGKVDSFTVHGNDYNTVDGTCVRDYIHVSDVADAHVRGLNWLSLQPDNVIENVNIGTGKGTSVLEIIHTFEEISGIELSWKVGPRRDGDISEIYSNVDKSRKLLKWNSSRSVKDAVRDTWNWELKLRDDK